MLTCKLTIYVNCQKSASVFQVNELSCSTHVEMEKRDPGHYKLITFWKTSPCSISNFSCSLEVENSERLYARP